MPFRAYNWQMLFFRPFLAAFLTASILFAIGCGGPAGNSANGGRPGANSANQNSNAARTNVEELGLLVRVPYEVEDVVWKENATKKTLIAVLRFLPADAEKVVAEATQFGEAQPNVISPETWFPEELIAQSDLSGDNALKGKAYLANGFLQAPYSSGKVTRIDGTDYFVIEATAK